MEKADLPHQPGTKPCDWPEDFAHENGNYMNTCVHCRSLFYGHKRRASCKVCSSANAGVSMDGEPMGDPHPCDSTNRPDLSAIRAYLDGAIMHLIEEVVDKRLAPPSVGRLNELAKVYAADYASPNHATFTVYGLRALISAIREESRDE